jgi:HEAT repeat protein
MNRLYAEAIAFSLATGLLVASPALANPAADTTASHAAPKSENRSWAVLREALKSRDYAVRLLATQGLGDLHGVDVAPWLAQSLGDPEHDVRVAAVDALSRIGSARALALLRSVRDDATEALDIRALAAVALLAHSVD